MTSPAAPASDDTHAIKVQAADAPIRAATVYSDRAEVSRVVHADLVAGLNQLSLEGLSELDEDSIRVSGVGHASIVEVRFESVVNHVIETDEAGKSELETLRSKLKALNAKEKRLQAERDAVNEQAASLESFAKDVVAAPSAVASETSLASRNAWEQQASAFFSEVVDGHFAASKQASLDALELEVQLEDLATEIQVVSARIYELNGSVERVEYKTTNIVHVVLLAHESESVAVKLTYMVNNAQWVPSYDIRVSSEKESLELTYKAEISQSSGEDWKDALLTLSTARASMRGDMETLEKPWSLKIRREPKCELVDAPTSGEITRMRVSPPPPAPRAPGMDTVYTTMVTEVIEVVETAFAPVMSMPVTEAKQSLTAATFEIPTRNTIPSDGALHKVTVAIAELKPNFSYLTAPKLAERVYLKAEIKNMSEYAFIEGPCAIFLDGSFVTRSTLGKTVSPLDTFEISLGVDPGITVVYGPLKKLAADTGLALFGKTSLIKFSRQITIKNAKRIPISIHVLEQFPMSQDEKIKVTLIEPAVTNITPIASEEAADQVPASTAKSIRLFQDKNVLDFSLTIAAGESKEVPIKFDVAYPEKERVLGLN
nr:hypothetical protein HK105_006806 [Polyrhizophydium stewartii]